MNKMYRLLNPHKTNQHKKSQNKKSATVTSVLSAVSAFSQRSLLSSLFNAPLRVFVAAVSLTAGSALASINVKLAEPKWEFLLEQVAVQDSQTQAQLASTESRFAARLQPLLAAQDHQAILNAFTERDIEQDSAALRQLRGQVLISLKQYAEAEKALTSALQLMPDLALAHRSLSMVYMVNKDYRKAQQHLTRTIELGVADAQVYGQLAFVNLQLHQGASAISGYQTALFLEPNSPQWQQGLLYALINAQSFSQAQALLDEMLQQQPTNADLWLQRGQIALKQGRSEQALSSLESALFYAHADATSGSFGPENVITLAQLHVQVGSAQRAVDLLGTNLSGLLANGSSHQSETQGQAFTAIDQVCQWLVYNQRWEELAQLLNKITAKRSQISSYFASRFDVYTSKLALQKGQTQQAQKSLMSSVKADPANGEALLTLAKLMQSNKRPEQAVHYYVRAQGLTSYKERALLGHAQIEIDRQRYADALMLLRQVVQLNPARNDVRGNIRSLNNLVRNET